MLTFLNLGRFGRLGNQMFQIASTIGIATRLGYDFAFPYWRNYDHQSRFHSVEDIDIQSYFMNPLPLVPERQFNEYKVPWGYHELNISDNTSLHGHMQCERYFEHCKPIIRHYFTLKKLSDLEIIPNSVALHIRLADYDGSNYHAVPDIDYYIEALDCIPSYNIVYIFSDEPEKARKIFGPDPVYIEGNHYMTDLYLMTQCKHFVISPSTFSWWGAWLGDQAGKIVVAPRRWFGPVYRVKADDIYCNDWIVI